MIPPGGEDWLHYHYDQRNLMISHTISISGTSPQIQAAYSYDGRSNRVQQVDDTDATPITTTYANDIVGLSQVLLADDGSSQTHMLYGLDLISQDDGNETRYPLADGLGSVRVEMVDDTIETTTTYAPFGSLLQQTGSSGTVYGFTGEQYDTSTEQLYLRARYYNPAMHTFTSKDPWNGNPANPQSMNGWSYVENNPANLIDLTGMIPFPDDCRHVPSYESYGDCVREAYDVYYEHGDFEAFIDEYLGGKIPGEPHCYEGPVPYRGPGYLEGHSLSAAIVLVTSIIGRDLVYDFASMERNAFIDSAAFGGLLNGGSGVTPPAVSLIAGGVSYANFFGAVSGFRNWRTLVTQYEGPARFTVIGGANPPWPVPIGVATGLLRFRGMPDSTIVGNAWYGALGVGVAAPYVDFSAGVTYYTALNGTYAEDYDKDDDGLVDSHSRLFADIRSGIPGLDALDFSFVWAHISRTIAIAKAQKYVGIYEGIHHDSYMRNR